MLVLLLSDKGLGLWAYDPGQHGNRDARRTPSLLPRRSPADFFRLGAWVTQTSQSP